MTVRWIWTMAMMALAVGILSIPVPARSDDYVVYSVYRELDMGNPGEVPRKDFYVTLGSSQGARPGTVLEVIRKVSTYDSITEKLYKDIAFPIARLRVIHSESNAAVARLEKMLPNADIPITSPNAVIVGDSVRMAE